MLLIRIVSLVVFAAVALQDVNYIGFILPDRSDKQSLSRLALAFDASSCNSKSASKSASHYCEPAALNKGLSSMPL
jgi:hypothetical protein